MFFSGQWITTFCFWYVNGFFFISLVTQKVKINLIPINFPNLFPPLASQSYRSPSHSVSFRLCLSVRALLYRFRMHCNAEKGDENVSDDRDNTHAFWEFDARSNRHQVSGCGWLFFLKWHDSTQATQHILKLYETKCIIKLYARLCHSLVQLPGDQGFARLLPFFFDISIFHFLSRSKILFLQLSRHSTFPDFLLHVSLLFTSVSLSTAGDSHSTWPPPLCRENSYSFPVTFLFLFSPYAKIKKQEKKSIWETG